MTGAKAKRDLERRAAREKLRELRAALAHARVTKKTAVCDARQRCKRERSALRLRLAERRARALIELRDAAALARFAARETCVLELDAAKTLGSNVARARAKLLAESAYRRELREVARDERAGLSRHRAATAAEKRSESDDEVRQNLPPEFLALFERVKRGIRASPRMTRTEALLHYAEEHPHELLAAIDDKTDALIAQLEADERGARRAARGRRAA